MPPPITLADIIERLRYAFPRQTIPAATIMVYVETLNRFPVEAVAAAADNAITTSKFFPSLSELLEDVAERTTDLPSETEALSQLDARVAWGRGDRDNEPPTVHPVVHEALTMIGGWASYRDADRPAAVRSQLLAIYRDLRLSRVRAAQSGRLELTS